jgi:hypothetical protein
MRIAITDERGQPPSGVVAVDDGPPQPFDGWLGLLRILSGAIQCNQDASQAAERRNPGEASV